MTKDEENSEMLNAFFGSLIVRSGNHPPELEDRDRKQNEA